MTHNALKEEEKISFDIAAMTHYPTPLAPNAPNMPEREKIAYIAKRFREIMWALGLDLEDDSLAETPERIAKMYVQEIFKGLEMDNFPTTTFFEDKIQLDNMIVVKTPFISMCEHHFLPMHGVAHVAYIPNGKIIGLSKIPRIVNYFASRPQLQERLTAQIADSLTTLLGTENIAVATKAEHFCVKARGVQDSDGSATMHALHGSFKTDPEIRKEFFSCCFSV